MILFDMLESKWDGKQVLPTIDKNWRWVGGVNWTGWICVKCCELLSYLNSKVILWSLDEFVSWLVCPCLSTVCHFCSAAIGRHLGNSCLLFPLYFPWVLLEFRIALNKIDQTDNLTTIISKMAHGSSFKAISAIYPNGLFSSCLQCLEK